MSEFNYREFMSHQRYEPMSLWSCGCALALYSML
uniref:Uncharacterized protein n=1 Tax=Anguilla anguilla TaxID=7936 RepID=A0A0E9PKE6_ANGAN